MSVFSSAGLPNGLGRTSPPCLVSSAIRLKRRFVPLCIRTSLKCAGSDRQTVSVRECASAESLADLILASSCTPPFTPVLSWKGRAVLDGGLIDNVPERALSRVICSGEALPSWLAQRFRESLPAAELHNLYGPTEATVDVTAWNCAGEALTASIPIGRPVSNTRIYILDGHGEPAPIGVAGEPYIGGAGVARGYLNRPGLTADSSCRTRLRGNGERGYTGRGSGAVASRWDDRVFGAQRLSGEDAGL